MTRRWVPVVLAAGACLALVLGSGCSLPGTPQPTSSPNAQSEAVTADRLFPRMPIPSMCTHDADVMVNGQRAWTDTEPGEAWVMPDSLVLGDLTGDGVSDGALQIECTAGGVSWGSWIVAYAMVRGKPELLGQVWTTKVDLPGSRNSRPGVDGDLRIADGVIRFQMKSQMEDDGECCPSLPVDVTVAYNPSRGGLVTRDVTPRWDEGTAVRLLALGGSEAVLSDEEEPAAVERQYTKDRGVLEAVDRFLEYALLPRVAGCYESLNDVPWEFDGAAPNSPGGEGSQRFCLVVQHRAEDKRAIVIEMDAAGAGYTGWTATSVLFGERL